MNKAFEKWRQDQDKYNMPTHEETFRAGMLAAQPEKAECQKVPDGYVPVPVEPSDSQLDVAVSFALNVRICSDYNWSAYMRDVYARMLAAAPKPEKAEPDCECGAVASEHCPACEPVAQEPVAWGCFEDTSYYNMWAVRPVGEMQWGKCFHLANNAEAETLCAVLNMQPDKSAEVEKWKDELRVERNWSGQQRERIAELEAIIEAQRTLYANASKIANESDELRRQQAVLVEALETCTPEGFCDYAACSAALASVNGNAEITGGPLAARPVD